MAESKEYRRLRKYLRGCSRKEIKENLIDCLELKEKNDLTKFGERELAELLKIFKEKGWKIPPIRKICKLTAEENQAWEKAYHYFVKKGVDEDILHDLCDKSVKEAFPRLKDCEVLY